MFTLVRAVVYASLFIGLLLVFLPAQVVARSGIAAPGQVGAIQVLGILLAVAGGTLAVSCILTFAFIGRGTPAPFDPPRRLVVRGPYRWVRNPMYVGATTALLGAALYYESLPLFVYGAGFLVLMHLFVIVYEEPTLRRTFGGEYKEYCRRVGRWWPRWV
ncbi:MAG TPA: isoprenylcysteine carboxylmethyltransferase family protein [Gemmatimonadales bacterium]|jgi:protein-S-isoprenylcysteine O-methyltransferase Ste14|nr:isoprenylcysteine carboxylmethyltransferase family protein [Gemmatimonadales bacterium]